MMMMILRPLVDITCNTRGLALVSTVRTTFPSWYEHTVLTQNLIPCQIIDHHN